MRTSFSKKGLLLAVLLAIGPGCASQTRRTEIITWRLRHAAERGDVQEVRRLLLSGADVNAKGPNQFTALHGAAMRGQIEVLKLLIASGADVNARTRVLETPLISAHAVAPSVALLISSGANIDAQDDRGFTALTAAAEEYTATESVRLLISAGADLNHRDFAGATPLMHAVPSAHEGTVRLLLEAGADPNIKSDDGYTALSTLLLLDSQSNSEISVSRKFRRLHKRIEVMWKRLALHADHWPLPKLHRKLGQTPFPVFWKWLSGSCE